MQLALNNKLAEFTQNAKKFTLDGGLAYQFKDEDDYKTAKKDLSHLKKAMAHNWVEQVCPLFKSLSLSPSLKGNS